MSMKEPRETTYRNEDATEIDEDSTITTGSSPALGHLCRRYHPAEERQG